MYRIYVYVTLKLLIFEKEKHKKIRNIATNMVTAYYVEDILIFLFLMYSVIQCCHNILKLISNDVRFLHARISSRVFIFQFLSILPSEIRARFSKLSDAYFSMQQWLKCYVYIDESIAYSAIQPMYRCTQLLNGLSINWQNNGNIYSLIHTHAHAHTRNMSSCLL